MSYNQRFFGEDPPKLWSFRYPQKLIFFCIFYKEFSKCAVLGTVIFFQKFPNKISEIFLKSKITIVLVSKSFRNNHVDERSIFGGDPRPRGRGPQFQKIGIFTDKKFVS